MSAKRSWDVRPNIVRPQQAPAPSRSESPSPVRSKEPLKVRRQKARRNLQIALGVVLFLLIVGLIAFLWQPFVRVQAITSEGPHDAEVRVLVGVVLKGTYGYVLPRDSIFIYPEIPARERVLKEFPDIVAVSISRSGFSSLSVRSVPRTSAFTWCGASALMPEPCYNADAEGLVFAPVAGIPAAPFADATTTATTTEPDLSSLRIYAPLQQEEADEGTPLRAHVMGAGRLPDALRFVKAMKLLNVAIVSVEIRGDEADLYTPGGTRITYILGKEVEAAALASSAFPTLSLNNGSLEYVDLRFEGKVYLKKRGGE